MSARASARWPTARGRWATSAVLISLAAGLGSVAAAPQAAQAARVRPATPAAGITFTSDTATTVNFGESFAFTVTTSASQVPALTKSGLLPPGVKFTANHDGTATLAGTPHGRAAGLYPLTFYANGHGFARQSFTLTVDRLPWLRHIGTVRAHEGVALDQQIITRGYPVSVLTESGALPSGMSFTDFGDGTGDVAGIPDGVGSYPVTVTATSALGSASETFTVRVRVQPSATSPDVAGGHLVTRTVRDAAGTTRVRTLTAK